MALSFCQTPPTSCTKPPTTTPRPTNAALPGTTRPSASIGRKGSRHSCRPKTRQDLNLCKLNCLPENRLIKKTKTMTSPESNSYITSPCEQNTSEQFTWLDLMLVIVVNLRLLVLGPLFAGLIAFVGVSLLPKTYESTAVLKGEQGIASLINSAAVLDPVAASLGYKQKLGADDARLKLKKQMQVQLNAKDKLITLIIQAESPEAAQNLAKTVLNQTYANSRPRESERNRLQRQLEQARLREKEASDVGQLLRKKLDDKGSSGSTDVAQGYAQIIRTVSESQAAQISLEQQMIGLDESVLIQEATLPSKHKENQQGLITVLVIQATLFLLMGWVFLRNLLSRACRDENEEKKLRKLKLGWFRALGLNF